MSYDHIDKPVLNIQTIQESVVNHLRNMILSRELIPGERLVQSELATQLGVSRTPIREALQILASEGLVNISSYKGASVAEFSLKELEEIYAVRTAIESHAAYLAAQRITEEELSRLDYLLSEIEKAFQQKEQLKLIEVHHQFHATIYQAAKQKRLSDLATHYLGLTDIYQRMALNWGRGAHDPVIEHAEILTVLRKRDADAVHLLIRDHLSLTVSELSDLFMVNR